MLLLLVLILFVLLVGGTAPVWPYSREWGYYPAGGIGFVLLVVLLVYLLAGGRF